MNLISHDCLSYLRRALATGLPHRRTMVMLERTCVRDKRLELGTGEQIAHADQAGQLDISGETRAEHCVLLDRPQPLQRMLHNTTHVPLIDWCPFCVASRGRSSPLRRVVVNKTADTLPKCQADLIIIRTVAECETQPCIMFVETRSGAVISFMCTRKGAYVDLTREILRF